jgi:hypothetical protein
LSVGSSGSNGSIAGLRPMSYEMEKGSVIVDQGAVPKFKRSRLKMPDLYIQKFVRPTLA